MGKKNLDNLRKNPSQEHASHRQHILIGGRENLNLVPCSHSAGFFLLLRLPKIMQLQHARFSTECTFLSLCEINEQNYNTADLGCWDPHTLFKVTKLPSLIFRRGQARDGVMGHGVLPQFGGASP